MTLTKTNTRRNALAGYQLGRVLASGSGGRVHLARQLGAGGRTVAIKRLGAGADDAVIARLQREGEILVALDHPNIVRVYDLVADGESVAIVMQYAVGGSLADRLECHGPLASSEVAAVGARCADALASAHRRGVLHRDIKPANILFTSDGEPLVSDFGVARWQGAPGLTRGGVSFGTAGYLAPETLERSEPDVRSDVYSLGVVCYQALAGVAPFGGANDMAVLRAADVGRFVPLANAAPDVPPALAAVVERAMARDLRQRFADAAEFAAALRGAVPGTTAPPAAEVCAGPPVVVPADKEPSGTRAFGPRPPRPQPPRARRRLLPRFRLPRLPRVGLPRLPALPSRCAVAVGAVAAVGVLAFVVTRPGPSVAQGASEWACPAIGQVGCDLRASVSGNVVELRGADGRMMTRFALGQRGDVAMLGDWRCRGAQTPGLYRPDSGQVFLFDGWADSHRSLTSSPPIATGVIGGRPVVARPLGGCDRIEVRPAPVLGVESAPTGP